jgi:hypothetical protein
MYLRQSANKKINSANTKKKIGTYIRAEWDSLRACSAQFRVIQDNVAPD